MDDPKTKTSIARFDAAQAERLVIAQETASEKIEAIFEILNSPSLSVKAVGKLLDIFGNVMSNMTKEGNSKFSALIVLGLAALANGMAFSGWGFETTGMLKCGPMTEEVDGWCVSEGMDPMMDAPMYIPSDTGAHE